MSNPMKKIKTNSLITAFLYTALGAVLLLWPEISAGILSTSLEVVLVVCGVMDIGISLTNRKGGGNLYAGYHLLMGIVLIVVGMWIGVQPELIAVVIPRIVGILICVHGLADIGDAVTLRRSGYTRWSAALVLGILTAAAGAVLIYDPFDVFTTVVRMIGLFLLYDGISDLWITSRVSKTLRQVKKDAEAEAHAVDVDYKDVPEEK